MTEAIHEPRFNVLTDNAVITQACVFTTRLRPQVLRQVCQIAQPVQGNK